MLAIIEALICIDLDRSKIYVLSFGCADDPYVVSPLHSTLVGKLTWYDLIFRGDEPAVAGVSTAWLRALKANK